MERKTRSYLQLIKPGITISNTVSAAAGYFLAVSIAGFSLTTMIGVLFGVAFIIASACVVNNILDRDRDMKMQRTRKREIPIGNISLVSAGIFSAILGIVGFLLLIIWTNPLTVVLGLVAFVWYVAIYGIAKRTTPLSTLIGGVCGALPPVAGYTAVMNTIDTTAWILFALLMIWQMAHFYAIAIFRKNDYESAGLPIWSVSYGTKNTKDQILFWVVLFALIVPLLTVTGVTGYIYMLVMAPVSIYWVYIGVANYGKLDDEKWAKKMFGVSLVALLVLCGAIGIGGFVA